MADCLNAEWLRTLGLILAGGDEVSPRGMRTMEIPGHQVKIDMRRPVLTHPGRELGYRFMAAEAYWILSGDDRVDTIAPYSRRIADFSDDGKTFFGAYGPRIAEQIGYVVEKLRSDPDTRQATLTTWRPCPPKTRDVPCTVAFDFKIRGGRLDLHVFMRSSDAWLGLPYDAFNFSMLAHLVCCRLADPVKGIGEEQVLPGTLCLTAASSHLYERNFAGARECLRAAADSELPGCAPTPWAMSVKENILMETLDAVRDGGKKGALNSWWRETR